MKNIYHEGKLINKAGVDRVVLSHVELKKINWPVFKKAITALSDIIYDAFRSANRTYYVNATCKLCAYHGWSLFYI